MLARPARRPDARVLIAEAATSAARNTIGASRSAAPGRPRARWRWPSRIGGAAGRDEAGGCGAMALRRHRLPAARRGHRDGVGAGSALAVDAGTGRPSRSRRSRSHGVGDRLGQAGPGDDATVAVELVERIVAMLGGEHAALVIRTFFLFAVEVARTRRTRDAPAPTTTTPSTRSPGTRSRTTVAVPTSTAAGPPTSPATRASAWSCCWSS